MSDLIKEARKFHITEDMDCHTERLIHKMADTIEQLQDKVDDLEYILKDCNCRQREKANAT
jgi:hypothetical protein